MTDYRAELQRLLEAIENDVIDTNDGPRFRAAVSRARTALAQPEPKFAFTNLAARPLLEKVAQMADCIGQQTVAEIAAISSQAAAWLRENPPGQPVAIEPRGCPTPGACSCVEPTALAQPEPEGVTASDVTELFYRHMGEGSEVGFENAIAEALTRWGRPTIEPVPVAERLPGCAHERFEFSVFDSEYEEQAGGTAPTYAQALSEGQHYLAMYSQDGPHSLELRRVEVLIPDALPVPTTH